jgi:hypothetical protein
MNPELSMTWIEARKTRHRIDPTRAYADLNWRTNRAIRRTTPAPRKAARQLVVGLVAIVISGRSALALEVVLVDRTSQATVAMADYPGDKSGNTVVVAWDNAPGDVAAGAMMFRRERHDSRTAYVAIGGGPVLIVDRGRHTLVAGTSVPVFEVAFAKDWDHPVQMVASPDTKLDIATLVGRYRTYEHIAGDREGKGQIDTAIRAQLAQTNIACKGSLRMDVAWTEFERAGQVALAKQTVGLLEALASSCADRDFKDAISKLQRLHIGYRADGALELAIKGSDVAASISPNSFNPRETARHWIKDNL